MLFAMHGPKRRSSSAEKCFRYSRQNHKPATNPTSTVNPLACYPWNALKGAFGNHKIIHCFAIIKKLLIKEWTGLLQRFVRKQYGILAILSWSRLRFRRWLQAKGLRRFPVVGKIVSSSWKFAVVHLTHSPMQNLWYSCSLPCRTQAKCIYRLTKHLRLYQRNFKNGSADFKLLFFERPGSFSVVQKFVKCSHRSPKEREKRDRNMSFGYLHTALCILFTVDIAKMHSLNAYGRCLWCNKDSARSFSLCAPCAK